ncbi:MAG: SBBP repeat-containing protein, partial [Blastocatellia bacterium]
MPVTFTENRGQADARAGFLVQGRETTAWFTERGMTLSLSPHAEKGSARKRWNLKLDFVGANPAGRLVGERLAEARVSYFQGARDSWRADVRTYSSIAYRDLWPGIDLVYSGTDRRLKYEFVVHPGADPRRIRMAWRGANAPLTVNSDGQLEIATPYGVIRDERPVSFQEKRRNIQTQFVLAEGNQEVGFKIGKYDKRKTLVIDPAILVYSGFLGGSGDDEGHSVAVDGNGNAYVTGVTTSAQASFPETAGPDLTYNGRVDAFVAKVRTDGAGLVYAGYIGGDGDDAGHGIAVDGSGNAYVTGWTNSTQATFPVLGGLDGTFNGAIDAFIAKINPGGTALEYCGYLGGDDEDEGLGIAVDLSGRAYVTGLTASSEATFPELTGPGLLFKGAVDAFVARVKADGSGLEYAGYLGGSGDDQGRAIAVDAGGNAYVTGLTTSTQATFPMVGALGASANGGTDAFVAKINAAGNAITYSGFLGGSGIDEAYGIAVDGLGSAFITGRTTSSEATFPKLIGPDLSFNGGTDAFVAKVNASGTGLSYAGYIGGAGEDEGYGIAIDGAGNAYVTGQTASSAATFPNGGAFDLTLNGTTDGFLAKVNPAGNALSYSGYLGGNGLEEGFGAAANGLRQVFITGRTTSSESSFPILLGPGLIFGGLSDAFVMRVDDDSVTCPAIAINPPALPGGSMGSPYLQTLTGANGTGPYSFTIVSGSVPPNLTLSFLGLLSGTPVQSGTFNFMVLATDVRGCSGLKSYTLTIGTCPLISVTPETLSNGVAFANYSQQLSASGGASPYAFTVTEGALPSGVTLSSTGLLSGAPTATGIFMFKVRGMDANNCFGERQYSVTISPNTGLHFYPLAHPIRLLDTRVTPSPNACNKPLAQIPGGAARTQPARGVCDGLTIPANAAAITGNITTVQSGGGFLTLYPSDATRPLVANSNYGPNEILNNVFTVGLGAGDGAFNIYVTTNT